MTRVLTLSMTGQSGSRRQSRTVSKTPTSKRSGRKSKARTKNGKKPNHKTDRLLTIFEVPTFLRFNRFIVTGYRHPAHSISFQTNFIKSLGSWHNETLNIWTHLFGLLLFVFLAIHEYCFRADGTRWNVLITSIGCLITMAGSVAYHSGMNRCQCQREYANCINFDVSGVIIGISSSALSPIIWGYRCNYIISVLCGLMALAMMTWSAVTNVINETATAKIRGKFIGSLATVRTLLGVSMVASNAVFHDRYQNMRYHLMSLGFLIAGGIVNVSRIPERFITAQVIHYIGNSHQIWHCIVIFAMLATYYGAVWDEYYWQMTEC